MEKYDIENLKKRAEQGDTYAMLYLGNIYRFGKDDIEPDAEKAFALYENAAKGGNTAGYLFMGVTVRIRRRRSAGRVKGRRLLPILCRTGKQPRLVPVGSSVSGRKRRKKECRTRQTVLSGSGKAQRQRRLFIPRSNA